MAQQQTKPALRTVDPVWTRIRNEAEEAARREGALATFMYSSVLNHDTLEQAVVNRIAARLDHADVSAELIRQAYVDALEDDPALGEAFRADIMATVDRDRIGRAAVRARHGTLHLPGGGRPRRLRLLQLPQGHAGGEDGEEAVGVQQQRAAVGQPDQAEGQEVVQTHRLLVLAAQVQHQPAHRQPQ